MESLYGRRKQAEITPRFAAAQAIAKVMAGQSLNQAIPALESNIDENERGFFRDLTLGTCRWYFRLNALAKILLKSPFQEEDSDLHALLLIGLYQLSVQGKAPHAAVHATVEVCDEMGKQYAKSVINACLRRYGREYEELLPPLETNPVTATSHPKWLVKMLTKTWPEDWSRILEANNERAPLCLRVNQRKHTRDGYLAMLLEDGLSAHATEHSADGIYLHESVDVTCLPEFAEGAVSVQDEAAQLAAQILAPKNGERILDACAAPGGKSCHLLETADISLLAVDADESRLGRVHENLARLGLEAEVVCADVAADDGWWGSDSGNTEESPFDAILLDVPCSATGVIRRHPDIRMLRRREDIQQLETVQAEILERAWALLKPGGRLLYATCSVLPQENSEQVMAFVNKHPEASVVTLEASWGKACEAGRQLFPQTDGHDGFYYALLNKTHEF